MIKHPDDLPFDEQTGRELEALMKATGGIAPAEGPMKLANGA
jgi:hypothetical protein